MSDPKRLRIDQSDPVIARLLEAGRADELPKPKMRRIMKSAGIPIVGLSASATKATVIAETASSGAQAVTEVVNQATIAATATAAATSTIKPAAVAGTLSSLSISKWVGISAIVTTATVGTAVQVATHNSESSTRQTVSADAAKQPDLPKLRKKRRIMERSAPVEVATIPDEISDPVTTDSADVANKRSVSFRQKPLDTDIEAPLSEQPVVVTPEELREQVYLVGSAKRHLDRGDAQEAMRYLRIYDGKYRKGELRPEALFIEMEVQLMLGRRNQAKELARQVISNRPSAPNARRARQILNDE
jgi:hypothetical protein